MTVLAICRENDAVPIIRGNFHECVGALHACDDNDDDDDDDEDDEDDEDDDVDWFGGCGEGPRNEHGRHLVDWGDPAPLANCNLVGDPAAASERWITWMDLEYCLAIFLLISVLYMWIRVVVFL